jgi:hypothetical protein
MIRVLCDDLKENLNSDNETWNDNLCDLQVMNGRDDSRYVSTTDFVCGFESDDNEVEYLKLSYSPPH